MKFLTPGSLLAAAALGVVVAIPLGDRSGAGAEYWFEAFVQTDTAGQAQLYVDDGTGFSEAGSVRATLPDGAAGGVVRLPLREGVFQQIRFDPIDRSGEITIRSPRIRTSAGRTLREFSLGDLKPVAGIADALSTGGELRIRVAPGESDPQLLIVFTPPLDLRGGLAGILGRTAGHALPAFFLVALVLAALEFSPGLRIRGAAALARLAQKPVRGVFVVAAGAVALSAYPVLFLGKSFVSPNYELPLLLDFPRVDHPPTATQSKVQGADVGALMWQQVAFSMVQHDAVAHGELPIWNRYNSAGVPLLGQGQSMFGDPIHLLVILADGAAWAWDAKFLIAKWIFAAAVGGSVLLLTGRAGPALIVAGTAPFIGFFVYRVNHPAVFSMCYAPAVLACWIGAARAIDRRAARGWLAGLFIANFALLNSGTVKEAYMLLVAMNFSGVCVLAWNDRSGPERRSRLGFAALSLASFVLASAPTWMTFLHTLKAAYTSYDAASAFQIQPSLLLGAFDELYYRPLNRTAHVFNPSASFVTLLGMLYFAATLRFQARSRIVLALALSTLPPLALAFGLVPSGWITRVPFLANVAHIDNAFSCALIIGWSVLAGVGFATAADRLRTPEGRGDLGIAGLLLSALVFLYIGFTQAAHRPFLEDPMFSLFKPGESLPVGPFVWGSLFGSIAAAILIAALARRMARTRIVGPAQVVALGACLFVLLWRFGMQAESFGYAQYGLRPPAREPLPAPSAAVDLVRNRVRETPARIIGLRGNLMPGWTAAYRLESINGPDALMSRDYRDLTGAFPIRRIWDWRLYLTADAVAAARPFLDFLNVGYYYAEQSDRPAMPAALARIAESDLDVYESATAWPRAFFTGGLRTYEDLPALVEMIRTAGGTPFAAVGLTELAKQPELARLPHGSERRAVAPAGNYELGANRTAFTVQADGPGVVVLQEAGWPGDIVARVNGQSTPVVRINHAFRGIVVDRAGALRVEFTYRPSTLVPSLALGALGALGFVGCALAARRSPRAAAPLE